MRNLKKILALVLALVMSLSLMATAGAADFTDASSINEKYQTAIEVLEGLGVFKGYQDGTFQPTGSITRAETAAIIYRIVTGDVKDEQVGIYKDYNLFTDVPSTSWFAGYVNYCANAEYIKGVGGGKFEPNSQVTGYAALAMILRAIGYTANGGFTGSDWEVQTARTAEARKITKNILTGTLGQNADRETVAEILFQAILVNMVDHNVDNTFNGNQGYFEKDITLGYKTFGLEELEGVVVANEFADLYSNQVLSTGRTNFEVADDDIRSLAITTEITDIGESRYAYITGSKVLAMGDTGLNVVKENNGAALDISTASKFQAAAEMPQASDIEYYVNFGRVGYYTSDFRIEYELMLPLSLYEARALVKNNSGTFEEDIRDNGKGGNTDDLIPVTGTLAMDASRNQRYWLTYSKVIFATKPISQTDLDYIRDIFYESNGKYWTDNNTTWTEYIGRVFVATQTGKDISDTISYNEFVDTYIKDVAYDVNWNTAVNGDWVKFIDNDNDGVCEYAFKTESWLDEATSTYTTAGGDVVLLYNDFDDATSAVRYMDGDVNVGDVVVCALIDNQILVEHAKDVTKTVNKYDWKNDVITTTDGDEYGQSGIGNATGMQELLATMDEKTEYIMYFDHFGYVRAYELPGGTQYALVTELYYTNNNNGNLVQNWPMTVELKVGEADKAEYSTSSSTLLRAVTGTPWTEVKSIANGTSYYNWLQPAIAHLGVTRENGSIWYGAQRGDRLTSENVPSITPSGDDTFWKNNYQLINTINSLNNSTEFNYGAQNYYDNFGAATRTSTHNITTSFTNVAVVNVNDNDKSAVVNGAAQLKLTRDGQVAAWNDQDGDGVYDPTDVNERPRYAVDYVQLDRTKDVTADQVRYPIGGNNTYQTNNNYYVNATHNTEFYIVYNGDVLYFKDYENMPALTNKDNYIHAAYAVARDTSADNAANPYWVADVIVYEVETYTDLAKMSLSLVYYNPSRTTGNVQLLKTLNNKYGPLMDLTPTNLAWNADKGQYGWGYGALGFYRLYNEEKTSDTEMTARRITSIDYPNFNENGIYAGTITRTVRVESDGTYIDINTDPTKLNSNGELATTTSVRVTNGVYSITTGQVLGSNWDYNEAKVLRCDDSVNSQVKPGDRVIWVGTNKGAIANESAFIVDLGNDDYAGANANAALRDKTASFLLALTTAAPGLPVTAAPSVYNSTGLWQRIMAEQENPIAVKAPVVKFYGVEDDKAGDITNTTARTITVSYATAAAATNGKFLEITGADKYEITSGTAPKATDAVSKTAKTWIVTIYGENEQFYTYNLVLQAAKKGALLDTTGKWVTSFGVLDKPDGTVGKEHMPIRGWLNQIELAAGSENATINWTIELNDGTILKAESKNGGNAVITSPAGYDGASTVDMKAAVALVTSEDGLTKNTYKVGTLTGHTTSTITSSDSDTVVKDVGGANQLVAGSGNSAVDNGSNVIFVNGTTSNAKGHWVVTDPATGATQIVRSAGTDGSSKLYSEPYTVTKAVSVAFVANPTLTLTDSASNTDCDPAASTFYVNDDGSLTIKLTAATGYTPYISTALDAAGPNAAAVIRPVTGQSWNYELVITGVTITGDTIAINDGNTSWTVAAGTVQDYAGTAVDGATITPASSTVLNGQSVTVTVTAKPGYFVRNVAVAGGTATVARVGTTDRWTVSGVDANVTVNVTVGYTIGSITPTPTGMAGSTDLGDFIRVSNPGLYVFQTTDGWFIPNGAGEKKLAIDNLVVVFNTTVANQSARIEYYDAAGTLIASESSGAMATTGGHYFYTQVEKNDNQPMSGCLASAYPDGLPAGNYSVVLKVSGEQDVTYRFTIGPVA